MLIHFNAGARRGPVPASVQAIVDTTTAPALLDLLVQCPVYRATPLRALPAWALQAGVAQVLYKDESQRFSLQSFKALGATYAVARLLHRLHWPDQPRFDPAALFMPASRRLAQAWTLTCATDGNHGRAVAAAAQLFGCRCVVFLHAGVSPGREQAIVALGAHVIRVPGDYDDSVRAAQATAQREGWQLVADTAYPGAEEVPTWVMQGYTVLLAEALTQAGCAPTHVFVQAGVGALAGAVAAYLWQVLGALCPRVVVVEPRRADCLYQSAVAGMLRPASGRPDSLLAGLACGEASPLAWQVLRVAADAFMCIEDDAALRLMRPLSLEQPPIVAGESATAGLAGLLAVAADSTSAARLGLDHTSRVLLFGTEGATDPILYAEHIRP